MKHFSRTTFTLWIFVCAFFAPGGFLHATQDSINTSVSVSANSGGNRAQAVSEGTAQVEVHITQEIDGVVQEPIDIVQKISEGSVFREMEITSEDGSVKTRVRTDVGVADEKENFAVEKKRPGVFSSTVGFIVFVWSSFADYVKLLFS